MIDSVPSKLCMFFVKNPGAVIYTDEIIRRWMPGAPVYRSLTSYLGPARREGFIVGIKKPGDARMYYEAGPALKSFMETL